MLEKIPHLELELDRYVSQLRGHSGTAVEQQELAARLREKHRELGRLCQVLKLSLINRKQGFLQKKLRKREIELC